MRKYTLYQAARYSKISRYKLEQAIKEGLLKIIPGKGNIKCFIFEDELKNFLDQHGDQYIKHDFNENLLYLKLKKIISARSHSVVDVPLNLISFSHLLLPKK